MHALPDLLPPPAKRKKRHKPDQKPPQKLQQGAAESSDPGRSGSTTDDYSINPLCMEPARATGTPHHSSQSSRIQRLAKLRRDARTNSRQAAPTTVPVCVEMVAVARRSADEILRDGTNGLVIPMTTAEEEQQPVAHPPPALRPTAPRPVLDYSFSAGIVIVFVVVSAIMSSSGTDDSLAALNCVRFETAASAACLHFAAFLLVAIVFQAGVDKVATAAWHRSIFSKLALALACAVAIAAAFMGHPRDACGECTCGACSVYMSYNNVNESQQECAAVEFGTIEETVVEDANKCSDDILPELCTGGSSQIAKAVISGQLSSSPEHLKVLFSLLHTYVSSQGASTFEIVSFDKQCSEQSSLECPAEKGGWTPASISFLQNILCDNTYRFCDAEDQSRVACPDTACCYACNYVRDIHKCGFKTHGLDKGFFISETDISDLSGDTEFTESLKKALNWSATILLEALHAKQAWGDCVETCMVRSDLTEWYGKHPTCLPNQDRPWQSSKDRNSSLQNTTRDECSCDTHALEWKEQPMTLRTVAFVGASFLITAQVVVALFLNGELVSLCKKPPKELVLALAITLGLIVGLIQQREIVARCEDIFTVENLYRMLSWTAMTLFMLGIAMFVGISSALNWVHGVEDAKEKECCSCLEELKDVYNKLFSYRDGKLFLLKGIVMEILEVGTQTQQLLAFSPERPEGWIVGLSVLLIFNGIMLPVPFAVQTWFPKFEDEAKLLLAIIDCAFDIGYIAITVTYSESQTFSGDAWWIATAGVLMPMGGIALLALDIAESGETTVVSRKDALKRSNSKKFAESVLQRESLIVRVMQAASIIISIFCIVTGSVFLHWAQAGDTACRSVLGDTIWEGSSPKIVIAHVNGSLQGACNFSAIKEISVTISGRPPMNRLSSQLLRLTGLETFVLKGQNIASDGVPAAMLDGTSLSRLERFEFGEYDPVSKRLNLSARQGGMLHRFPEQALRLLTGLTSLDLEGQNISCLPNVQLLRRLRRLNVRGTKISYLPPSVVFSRVVEDDPESEYKLDLDVTSTPVSSFLNWSHHGLAERFEWERMTSILPALTSLDLSENGLTEGRTFHLDDLPKLRRLDLSDNPSLFENGFFGWQSLSVLGRHRRGTYRGLLRKRDQRRCQWPTNIHCKGNTRAAGTRRCGHASCDART